MGSQVNEINEVAQGWISNDEASEEVTGTPAYGPPLASVAPAPPPGALIQGDGSGQEKLPQTANATWVQEVREARAEVANVLERISSNGFHAN